MSIILKCQLQLIGARGEVFKCLVPSYHPKPQNILMDQDLINDMLSILITDVITFIHMLYLATQVVFNGLQLIMIHYC